MQDRALWISWYDLLADGCDDYLAWVRDSYIPMLLKRPGILAATHYVNDGNILPISRVRHTTDSTVGTGNEYICIVSAEHAHAFANPVPAKFHAGLPETDRKFLAMRLRERMNIFTEEHRMAGPVAAQREGPFMLAPCIQLGSFNANSHLGEDEVLAWYAQFRLPSMTTLPGCIGIRKMVSVAGWAKHGVLYEFVSAAEREKHFRAHERANPETDAWTARLVPTMVHAPLSPNVAHRLWPPVKGLSRARVRRGLFQVEDLDRVAPGE